MWTPPESDGRAGRLDQILEHIASAGYDPDHVELASIEHRGPADSAGDACMAFTYDDGEEKQEVRIAPMPVHG